VHRIVSRSPDRLGSNRGDWIVVIARDTDRTTLLRLTDELTGAVEGVLPAASVRWGVSAPCQHAIDLPVPFGKPRPRSRSAAGSAALGWSSTSLGSSVCSSRTPGASDLLRFVREALGSLIDYDTHRDGVLVPCRPASTGIARRRRRPRAIPVHHKTLGYRRNKIEKPVSTSAATPSAFAPRWRWNSLCSPPDQGARNLTPASSFSNPVSV